MGSGSIKHKILSRERALRKKFTPKVRQDSPVLVQEEAGIHVGISADLPAAASHAAQVMQEQYERWRDRDRFNDFGHYKRQYFVIAVGGGNTVKAQYRALVEQHHESIDWISHTRFFFLEDSSGEPAWESPEKSLILNFIVPLAGSLIRTRGQRVIASALELQENASAEEIVDQMVSVMLNPINMAAVRQALEAGNRPLALKYARQEADRYQLDIQTKLGATMVFHYLVSGIGKHGALGAFAPYMPELRVKDPGTIVLKPGKKALRVALNRGVLVNANAISLIVSGNLKLRALGRFEIEETADFEQTVMETPLRMLRETVEIAEKVYIFADETALHFEETQFKYAEHGEKLYAKAETRKGEEDNGVHILLLHGFMGLFSFANFLVRLPSAWTVSALHRGSHAKNLASVNIFPHYARALRHVILDSWSKGRPTPIAGHSIAGIISDHLLCSLLRDHEAPITPYAQLKGTNKKLVDALRTGGIIHLATWAPTDGLHTGRNIKNVISHYRQHTALDYSGFEQVYQTLQGQLQTTAETALGEKDSLSTLGRFLDTPIAQPLISSLNVFMRSLLNNRTVQQKMLNTKSPYVLRLVGNRLLKTASFYGMCKEINAAMHDPVEYQKRHLRALDILVEYDIPFLSIVHEDDFLVSAERHKEEHRYLVDQRKHKEGVSKEAELETTTRYIMLKRAQDELPLDPLNPHLMIIATTNEANSLARQITAAMTRFVNENIARAARKREVKSLPSVRKWVRENKARPTRRKTTVA